MARILVIDDEPSILESLNMFLTEKGHRVDTAETGTTGLTLFLRKAFHVVIMDIRLPDVNGLEVLQSMMAEKKPSKFRIPESKVIPYVTKSHESDLLEKEAILELVADILSIRRSLV